jgi:P-type E1-E2 ATPase
MLVIEIPGRGRLEMEHLVLDMNGTVALDGTVLPGVAARLQRLRAKLAPVVLTADTHGGADRLAAELNIEVRRIGGTGDEATAKQRVLDELRGDTVISIGNGANDVLMLRSAAIGICVLGHEGTATEAIMASDVVVADICDALDLPLHPARLVATLRR